MQIEKKKNVWGFLLFVCGIVCVIGAIMIGIRNYHNRTAPWRAMAEWGIELPQNVEVLYRNWKTGWFGDGFCYTVVEMEPETAAKFTQDFSAEKPDLMEKKIGEQLENLQESDAKQIPEEFALGLPVKEDMIYKEVAEDRTSDRLYMLYDGESGRLYICEIRI